MPKKQNIEIRVLKVWSMIFWAVIMFLPHKKYRHPFKKIKIK